MRGGEEQVEWRDKVSELHSVRCSFVGWHWLVTLVVTIVLQNSIRCGIRNTLSLPWLPMNATVVQDEWLRRFGGCDVAMIADFILVYYIDGCGVKTPLD